MYTPEFKKEFWEWFDSLPKTERKKFQEYPADMAELYFFNKIYTKKTMNARKENEVHVHR